MKDILLAPVRNRTHLVTICLLTLLFAGYRSAGGGIHGVVVGSGTPKTETPLQSLERELDKVKRGSLQPSLQREESTVSSSGRDPIQRKRILDGLDPAPAPTPMPPSAFADIKEALGL